jgi:hypothetical protein
VGGKFLVRPSMSDGSKRRGQTKCSSWPSRLSVGHGVNNPTPEESSVTKLPELTEDDHGGDHDPPPGCSDGK